LAATASGQTLTVQGDRFAVDGTQRFLTFISYYGAMGAFDPAADLQYVKANGFDGVRIFPNWFNGPQLMRSDGSLDGGALGRLTYILDRARDQQLIVDVTFACETVANLGVGAYKNGLVSATQALAGYGNILFDIQNERDDIGCFGQPMSEPDVKDAYDRMHAAHADRVIVASSTGDAGSAASFTSRVGLWATAFHDPRICEWYQWGQTAAVVGALRSNGKPAYLQEPSRYGAGCNVDNADYFRQAVANAKLAGAAAWCFHTDLGFNLQGGYFESALNGRDPERSFVTANVPMINLRAIDGTNHVVAENGGGGVVQANRPSAGAWETFRAHALSGGPLVSGDRVTFRTYDGWHYLQATNGGGSSMTAIGQIEGPWETFVIDKPGGGMIWPGDQVTLRTEDGPPWYVCAEGGGGGDVNVNRTSAGAWETFTILFQGR
jgi:hypothetical protein